MIRSTRGSVKLIAEHSVRHATDSFSRPLVLLFPLFFISLPFSLLASAPTDDRANDTRSLLALVERVRLQNVRV